MRRACARRHGAGRPANALPPLPVQYADYTLWQHEVLGEESDPRQRHCAPAGVLDARRLRTCRRRSRCRPTGRGPRWRAIGAAGCRCGSPAELHEKLLALARASGASLFMVLQAGLAALLTPAGRGPRHPDRQPGGGPRRSCARRPGGVLRQHPGAAHRHLGQSELPRPAGAGAHRQPGGLRPPGPAVRAAGGGAQPGALAVASSAVPGDAGVPERRPGEPRAAGTAHRVRGGRRSPAPSSTCRSRSPRSAPPTARPPASRACWNMPATCSTRRPPPRWPSASSGCSPPPRRSPPAPIGSLDILSADERRTILTDVERHRARRSRTPPSRSCSPSRPPARPTPSRWSARTRPSATASSTSARTSSPTTCARSAPGPRPSSGCASSAPSTW